MSINEKVKQNARDNAAEMGDRLNEFTVFGGDLFKPILEAAFKFNNKVNQVKGDIGEVFIKFILSNSRLLNRLETIIVNDAVLEVAENQFIQVDHIIISENGIFLIETKNWRGAYTGYRDKWRVKTSAGWEECKSPTKQHQRHQHLFKKWINENGKFDGFIDNYIYPVVVINASWLKVTNCSVEVVDGYLNLLNYIEHFSNRVLRPDLINAIGGIIANAQPYEKRPTNFSRERSSKIIGTGFTKDGRKYVRINGSKEDAAIVAKSYSESGHKVSDIRVDRQNVNVKYFYIEQLNK